MSKVRSSAAALSTYPKHAQPMEAMERRRLLSVAVNNGVLTIAGSQFAEMYSVAKSGSDVIVTEYGNPQTFPLAGLTGILANLGAGNDSITIADDLTLNATVNGGDGNDTLTGGGGDDALTGDGGDDLFDGRSGLDTYIGGDGIDTASYASRNIAVTVNIYLIFLTDDDGNAELHTQGFAATVGPDPFADEGDGGNGIERVIGTSLDDTLTTSISVDYISFQRPDFSPTIILDGRDGHDTLKVDIIGNAGSSPFPLTSIVGGNGNDTIVGGYGADTIAPGLGDDSVDGVGGNDILTYEGRGTAINGQLKVSATQISSNGNTRFEVTSAGTVTGANGESDTFTNIRSLIGGDGNDTLSVRALAANNPTTWENVPNVQRLTYGVSGGPGNDDVGAGTSLAGVSSAEYTVPMFANGDAGNDTLTARLQMVSTLNGGDGDDTFITGDDDATPAQVVPGNGIDSLELQSRAPVLDNDTYTMPDGLENLRIFDAFGVRITGNALNNRIEVRGRNVSVFGGDGNDTILTRATSTSHIRGEAGDDTIRVNADEAIDSLDDDRNDIDGGAGGDLVVINGGTDTVHGGDGNDSIYTGVGDDRVFGDAGNDRLNGDGGKDTIYGGDGDDRVYGNSGADRLYGDAGVDRLYGGNKNDYLDGGAGGDYIKGDEGTDTAKKDKKDRRYESIEIFA